MAQLAKLYNYISRYERNIYHYPGQFVRLKKEKWEKANGEWNDPQSARLPDIEKPRLNWRRKFRKEKNMEIFPEEENSMIPLTDTEKRQVFLDSIFPFQLKWASSTISQLSFVDDHFKKDKLLKYFLQRYSDTYLLFYHPVFSLRNATMETDILFVGPYGIDIIRVMESSENKSFTAESERFWFEDATGTRNRIASPLLSLNRSERVVKGILDFYGIDFPVRKIVLSRTNEIFHSQSLYNTTYIDKRAHQDWIRAKRENAHLLKHKQLQVCGLLLSHCDSVAFQRPEWDNREEATEEDFTNFD